MDQHAHAFNAGNFRQFVGIYDFPLAMEVEGQMMLFVTPDALVASMRGYRLMLAGLDSATIRPRVKAVELPRHSRFRIWTSWLHFDAAGTEFGVSEFVYHCRDRRDHICVEMVSVLKSFDAAMVPAQPTQAFRA
ncbi:hypothetical protein [Rhodobacter ferrooxidans]|uniref:SnoaL-like domain-containing protein n=1 Tax=Rhodobacter ferrooxidans TaxID=371731 RepID=C8RXL4_9RHOB|nr:hypothetical protein [Rhodobacter sp. SW2]EEW26739.1 hypothetical protein Rsw2DRAFT_0542 [Rhodobacter sp. SW2]